MNVADFNRLIAPIKNKIMLMIGRCILKAVDNTGTTQLIQVSGLKNETISGIERPQEYGLETYPKVEAESIVIFPNGNRDQGLCIKVHDRNNRPSGMNSGDVALYDSSGNKVVCRDGGVIEIHGNGGTLEFVLLASLMVAKINSEIISKHNVHFHTSAGPGNPSSVPTALMTPIVDADVVSDKVKVS